MELSRRERLRTATVAEIKGHARGLLVRGGPTAISLRAIARDMGMTAPAIYRYFPSLDALVRELTEDLYDELRETIEAASEPDAQPLVQLLGMARAFRRWSLGHQAEFALMFGNPVPGVAGFEEGCVSPGHAGARFGAPFLAAFGAAWQRAPFDTPPAGVIEAELGPYLLPYRETFGHDVPVQIVYAYLSAWTRLYGMVALEVFGHMRWAVTDMGALFELELTTFAQRLLGL